MQCWKGLFNRRTLSKGLLDGFLSLLCCSKANVTSLNVPFCSSKGARKVSQRKAALFWENWLWLNLNSTRNWTLPPPVCLRIPHTQNPLLVVVSCELVKVFFTVDSQTRRGEFPLYSSLLSWSLAVLQSTQPVSPEPRSITLRAPGAEQVLSDLTAPAGV